MSSLTPNSTSDHDFLIKFFQNEKYLKFARLAQKCNYHQQIIFLLTFDFQNNYSIKLFIYLLFYCQLLKLKNQFNFKLI